MALLQILLMIYIYVSKVVLSATFDCTLTGTSVNNLEHVLASCREISIKDLVIPADKTLTLKLQDGSTLTFEGNITFTYVEREDFLISITGRDLTITGAPGHLIDGQGARWDGLGGGGGVKKPRFIEFKRCTNLFVSGLNIRNTPKSCVSIKSSSNVTLTDITFDDSDGDKQGGHNTDGINTSDSKKIVIRNSFFYNQDDCIAINSGNDIVFENNYCSGSHGISIGSVGGRGNNVVENIYVRNCSIVKSRTGVRIKTNYNTSGIVRNVTYEDITLNEIQDYGIVIRGDYAGPSGKPTSGFEISHITLKNIKGNVRSKGYNVYIMLANGVASDWTVKDIKVVGGKKKVRCKGIPKGSNLKC